MKVGTKILIKETDFGCKGVEGKIGVVTNEPSHNGLLSFKPGYNVALKNGRVWRINPDAEVEVLEPVFGKHLLRDGVIVKCRNNYLYIVLGERLIGPDGWLRVSDYDNDLKIRQCDPEWDIVTIYRPDMPYNIKSLFDMDYLKLIAERPEEVKEMTLAEVCKELGYNVKIVKEV